ncbi:MAG: hypothetical protein LBI53_07875 [Candidatus Peribacteria bacterium]|jgi:hypothetical protein|nr:hypothetical protein [Candidatus Peribacteria bacterium]
MNIPCQVQLTKMLIYVFVKYLQDNPDYFEEVVQWRKEELDKYYEYIDEQCKKEAESRRKQQEEDFGNEYECEQQEEGLED